jgi:hypothetical protein
MTFKQVEPSIPTPAVALLLPPVTSSFEPLLFALVPGRKQEKRA